MTKETKIQTKQQTVAAINEIQDKTEWSIREIARRTNTNYQTLARIMAEKTVRTPSETIRTAIYTLLLEVRELEPV